MNEMTREACPNAHKDCPYFDRKTPGVLKRIQRNGCFSDTDHIVPQRLAREAGASALTKLFIRHPVNQQQLCRWEHDIKTRAGDEQLPPEATMAQSIIDYDGFLSLKAQEILSQYFNQHQEGLNHGALL